MDERAKPEIGSDDLNPGAQIPSWIPRGARPVTSRSDPLPSGTVADPLELAADLAPVARTCVEAAEAAAAAEQALAVWVDHNPKAAAAIAAWAEERGPQLPSVGEVEETDRSTFLVEAEQLAMTVADAQASTGLDSADITDWLLLAGDRDRADAGLVGCKQAQQVAESDVLAVIAVNSKALDGRESKTNAAGPQMLALTSSCTSKPAAVDGQIAGFIPALSFTVTSGQAVEVSTSNLTLAGAPWASSTPDSVIYLLRCAAGDCTQGSIIAVNDDGNSATAANGTYPWDNLDSRIQIASGSLAAGTYYVLVLKYGLNGEGRGRIQARVGPTLGSLTTVVDVTRTFAGSLPDGRLLVRELKANDIVAVGRDDNTGTLLASAPANYPFLQANPEYADSTLWMFSNATANCTTNCGNFQQNQDAFQFFNGANPSRVALSRAIVAGAASTTPLVAIGTANERLSGNEGAINVRLLHVRKHNTQGGNWTCNEQVDLDGDGLPWDLEDDVGSCDRVLASTSPAVDTGADIGILGRNCRDYAGFINQQVNQWQTGSSCPTTFSSLLPSNPGTHQNCWDPKDSDNDGLRDDQEVFAAVGAFTADPPAPLYEATPSGSTITISAASTSCPSGWCTGVDLSAYGDPRPSVFDVYVTNSAFECTGSNCSSDKSGVAQASQEIDATEQQWLVDSWTEAAQDCWNSTSTCVGTSSADRPYQVRMHAMNGAPIQMTDTLTSSEISWPAVQAAAGFAYNPGYWPLGWRHLGLSRFSFSGVWRGGASDGARLFGWGNPWTWLVQRDFTHEAGHTLTLFHTHNVRNLPSPSPGELPGIGAEAGDCSIGQCSTGTCRCATPACSSGGSTCTAGQDANNPASPSIMSYNKQLGSGSTKSNSAPLVAPSVSGGCDSAVGFNARWWRFSKGLTPTLNEAALVERMPQTDASVHLVQHLRTTSMFGAPVGNCPSGACRTPYGLSNSQVPYCDGTTCYIDWNEDQTASATPVQFDISHGDWDGDGSCNNDMLADIDEWAKLMALARQNHAKSLGDDYPVLKTTFNGGTAENVTGFPETISTVGSVSIGLAPASTYPRNMCASASDCAWSGATCNKDTCSTGTQCASGTCSSGVCTCSSDGQCDSGVCENGACATDFGVCSCTPASTGQCAFADPSENTPCPGNGACGTTRTTAVIPPALAGSSDWKPYESAGFPGSASVAYVNMTVSATSAGATLPSRQFPMLRLDFTWNGFSSSSGGVQRLFDSELGTVELLQWGTNKRLAQLRFTAKSSSQSPVTLTVPSSELIRAKRWYRITWSIDRAAPRQWVKLRRWNMAQGGMDDSLGWCWRRALPSPWNLTTPTYFRFGGAPSDASKTLDGRLDNLLILSHSFQPPKDSNLNELCTTVSN